MLTAPDPYIFWPVLLSSGPPYKRCKQYDKKRANDRKWRSYLQKIAELAAAWTVNQQVPVMTNWGQESYYGGHSYGYHVGLRGSAKRLSQGDGYRSE